jgi:cell wall-associated NlpC family hydrolase
MQEAALGAAVSANPSALCRGDLVFWKGHVAIARDRGSLLHANAYHMAVAIEPITDAVVRIRNGGGEITSIRRIAST